MPTLVSTGSISIVDQNDGKTYVLNITGGVRSFNYDAAGANPTPAATAYTAELTENGTIISTGLTYSWTCGGLLSGTSSVSTFTPTVNVAHSSVNTFVQCTTVYQGITSVQSVPITMNRIGASATSLTFINGQNCTTSVDTITKTSGTSGEWDAGVRTAESYVGGCYASVVCQTGQTGWDLMFGLNTVDSNYSYTDLDYAVYLTMGTIRIYESGTQIGSAGFGNYVAGDVITIMYNGNTITYLKNSTILFQKSAVITDPIFFDSALATLNSKLGGIRFGPLSNVLASDFPNVKSWKLGTAGTVASPAFPNFTVVTPDGGGAGANDIIMADLPNGTQGLVWRLVSGTSTIGNYGGWQNSGNYSIDKNRMYRISCYFKMQSSGTNKRGTIYMGVTNNQDPIISGMIKKLDNTIPTNTFGIIGDRSSVAAPPAGTISGYIVGEWYFMTMYIYPSGYTGTDNLGGIYRVKTGQRVSSGTTVTSFKWDTTNPTKTTITHAVVIGEYGTNEAGTTFYLWGPKIEQMDGTESALDVLDVAKVNSTISGNKTTGGRVEVDNSSGGTIRIFDGSNVLRVKIGYLI